MEGENLEKQDKLIDKRAIINEIMRQRNLMYKHDMDGYLDRMNAFAKSLCEQFSNCEAYPLYHVMGGSSPKEEHLRPEYELFDFPGDLVAKFMQETYDDFFKKPAQTD